jgi:uncharacterized membrane protein
MEKYIVSVFEDQKKAYAGAQALDDLDREGSIALFEGAIISKSEKGGVNIEHAEEEAPLSTVSGMALGSLIGVIGGPVGMLAGAAVGSLGGMVFDIYNVGVNDEFLDEVAASLTPGKYALVAEVSEGWTVPLDTRMEKLGATVFRSWRIDVEDEQIDRDIEATKRELAELKQEWKDAMGDAKEKLSAKMDAARARLKSIDDRAKKKVEALKQEMAAKVKKLDEQIAKADDSLRKKYEQSRDELKADYERRTAKLKQAGQALGEALA